MTIITMIAEIVCGLLFGSMALLADGWHMASHASAMGVAALAYFWARKHRDNPRFSFGTGKIGDLAGYSSAILLGLIALFMAYESFQRLLHPVTIRFNQAIIVALVGLVVNLVSALVLRERPHHRHGGHHHDPNLRAAYLHVLADALTSILAVAALLFGKLWGWGFMDPVMGIVGALVISRWSYGLLRDTGRVLLDYNPDETLERRIREALEEGGKARVEDFHLWRLGPGHYGIIVSLRTEDDRSPEDFKHLLCSIPGLSHVTIEVRRERKSRIAN